MNKNKNAKCPIDAHCHRHCRKDPRISKDFKDWIGAKNRLASGGPSWAWCPTLLLRPL